MKMKNKIIEICELGQPQSIIHRENEPITELIKTDSLIEELNKQLTLTDVVRQSEQLVCPKCKSTDCKTAIYTDFKECNKCYYYW
jgi:hypothetical protein